MAVPARYLLRQGPNLIALAKGGASALRKPKSGGPAPTVPGPLIERTFQPPTADHVASYVRHTGGNPAAYKGVVPGHMFSFWAFQAMSACMEGLPYDLSKALNAGCSLTFHAPLPAKGPWIHRAQLVRIDEDDRRVLLVQRHTTGPLDQPEALEAETRVLIPKRKPKGNSSAPPKVVPSSAEEIGWWRLSAGAGLDYALLTGDFNPIHWIPLAGRAAGFGGCILHGFSTLSRAVEGLTTSRLAGQVERLASIDARFVRPVRLPGRVGLYLSGGDELLVGRAPGAPASLVATISLREDPS